MIIKPIMKGENDNGTAIFNGLIFYPAERVHEIFARMEAVRGKGIDTAELRIFAERMTYLYKSQCDKCTLYPDTEDLIRLAAYGEAVQDMARTESIRAGQ
jgi:hypothetical protein